MSFRIRKLCIKGNSVKDAVLQFSDGLNVITGPSNTGKSYIFECIDYMLGSSEKLKHISQAKGYDTIFLEIEDSQSVPYTLQSDLKGGNFKLYNDKIDEINESTGYKTLDRKHASDNIDNISAFFLQMNNLLGVKIRKNNKGNTRHVSYRNIVRFMLIDEERIITKQSPIVSGQYTTKTEEESLFKFFITGIDDSSVVESLSVDQIKYRKGKIELLNEQIEEVIEELAEYSEEKMIFGEQLLFIEENIKQSSSKFDELKILYNDFENKRTNLSSSISEKKSQEIYFDELLIRAGILREQYESDVQRLKATIEVSSILVSEHTFEAFCPLCNNQLNKSCSDDNILQIIKSCELEVDKIIQLINELHESIKLINKEKLNVAQTLEQETTILNSLTDSISNEIIAKITGTKNDLEKLNKLKNKIFEQKYLKSRLEDLTEQKNKLDKSVNSKPSIFEGLTTSLVSNISRVVENVLLGCNYPNLNGVSFSESNNDFLISDEDRKLGGKGFRAITYSAFIIALHELIYDLKFSIGVPVLDSPLVTYRKPTNSNPEEGISIDLARDFYRYAAKNTKIKQLIILENEEPPEDIVSIINHIKFTQSTEEGRYGFFPSNE